MEPRANSPSPDASRPAAAAPPLAGIGIVIPAWNEHERVPRLVAALHRTGAPVAIVVADCGSTDGTADAAREAGAAVARTPEPGTRARAMNAGAAWVAQHAPQVEILWFVHADCEPPDGWDAAIRGALDDERVSGGAFDFAFALDEAPWWMRIRLRIISLVNRARFRLTRSYFGDQGIFVRRPIFEAIAGFPDVALLEDVLICRRLRREGPLRLAHGTIRTSPRRFVRNGPITQGLVVLAILIGEHVGIRPARLYAWYNRGKG